MIYNLKVYKSSCHTTLQVTSGIYVQLVNNKNSVWQLPLSLGHFSKVISLSTEWTQLQEREREREREREGKREGRREKEREEGRYRFPGRSHPNSVADLEKSHTPRGAITRAKRLSEHLKVEGVGAWGDEDVKLTVQLWDSNVCHFKTDFGRHFVNR